MSSVAWCLAPPSFFPTNRRTRRRPRTVLCTIPLEESDSSTIPSNSETQSQSQSPTSTPQFSLLTDSILELKWKNEQSKSSPVATPLAPPPYSCRPHVTTGHPDDLVASDPYKAFARFTRLAAPTAAIGRNDVPLSPELSTTFDREPPYSAASIAHRIMRYTYARKNLDDFLTFFQGEFDNYDQIASERGAGMLPGDGGGHEHIHCSITQISPDLLFARYYFNGDPSRVFRSRLYRVGVNDNSERGIVEMKIFRFYEETEQQLKANNYDITSIEWNDDDVYDWLAGCEVFWERYTPSGDDEAARMLGIELGSRFVGYMKGGGCEFFSREVGGCIRVMDDLLLTSEELWVADRGFDEQDNFVYGNRRGVPYKMRRVRQGSANDWTLFADRPAPTGYVP